jgi:hypothetical protein
MIGANLMLFGPLVAALEAVHGPRMSGPVEAMNDMIRAMGAMEAAYLKLDPDPNRPQLSGGEEEEE